MKRMSYEEMKIREAEADLHCMASYALDDLFYLQAKRPTELTFVKMLSERLAYAVVNIENPTAPDSSLDPTYIVMLGGIFSSVYNKKYELVTEIISETGKFVNRLENLVNNVKRNKKIPKKEISELKILCREISSKARQYFDDPYLPKFAAA